MTFNGPVDTEVAGTVAPDLLATLREALSNVARHANAAAVRVEVNVASGTACLRVEDDGDGMPADLRDTGHGLVNMRTRAERHGGTLSVASATPHGTRIEWEVPLASGRVTRAVLKVAGCAVRSRDPSTPRSRGSVRSAPSGGAEGARRGEAPPRPGSRATPVTQTLHPPCSSGSM